jgi:hypothetical protein
VDALLDTLDDPDGFLRFKSIVAIERLQRARPDLLVPVPAIETRLLNEGGRHCELLSLRYNLVERDPDCRSTLLLRALDDKLARSLDRMFRLIGLLYSWTDVAAARTAIEHGGPRQRADALEYLEQVMSAGVRKRVMPLLDEAPMSVRVRHANLVAGTRPRDVPDTLVWLFHDVDPVVASAAVHFVGDRGLRDSLADDLDYLTASKATSPLVREAAIWVRSTSVDVTVPVVELVNRLRGVPVFALVSMTNSFESPSGAVSNVIRPALKSSGVELRPRRSSFC